MKTRKPCANISTLLKKRLLLIIAGVMLCCSGVWGASITWTGTAGDNLWDTPGNWNTGSVPGASDTVIINGTQTITMPNSDIVIDSLTIATTGDSSISFVTQSDKKFSITNTTTLNKFKDNAPGQTYSAVLNIEGTGTFTTQYVDMPETFWGKEFSINIDKNATLEITGQIYANIGNTSQFTISGSGTYCPPPLEYNGNKQEISEDVVQKKVNGDWTLSSHALQLGTTTTVEISNSVNQFEKVYADILIINNDTTTTEEYKINGTTITTSTDINLGSSKNTHTLSISIPATVDSGDVITIDFYADDTKTQKIGNTLFFRGSTPPATTSTWTGIWDTTPSPSTKNIIIVTNLTIDDSNLKIDFPTNYPLLTKLTVRENATLTSSAGTNFNNIQIINNGTIELTGSETYIDTSKNTNGSGTNSTIVYTSTATPLWGTKYNNLTVSSSANLTISNDITVNTKLKNEGTISNGANINIQGAFEDSGTWSGTGKIIFNGTTDQNFTPNSTTTYSEIEEDKTAGNLTVDSDLSATTVTLTKGTETTFSGVVTINTFSDTSNAGKINFNAGGTITSATTFSTTGIVQFGDNTADSLSFGANTITHTAGITNLYGTVTAESITLGNVNVNTDTILATPSLTLTSGKLDFSTTNTTLTINGDVSITGTYSLGDARAGKVTLNPTSKRITNSGTLSVKHSSYFTGLFENSGSMTISGTTVTFNEKLTNTGSISVNSGKSISVKKDFDDSRSTTATTGAISFTGTSNQSFTPNTGTTYSSIEINASGSTVTVADTLTTATLTITTGTIELNNQATVTGNLSNSGTINSNAEIIVKGNFTDSGTFTAGTNSKITLSGNTNQEFAAGTSTYENITVNKTSGKTSFTTNSLNANTVVLTASASVDFKKSVTLTTITDSSASGDISFYENGTITNSADFQTTGNITIAQNKTLTISNSADFTHTSGTTTLEGNITAANITMGNVSLKHGVTLTGNVTLSGGANASNKKSLDDTSSHTMTIKGYLIINGFYEIGTTKNQTIILDPVTGPITNTGTLSIPHSSSFTGNFSNTGTGTLTILGTTVKINGSLTNSGKININSGKTLSISGNFDDSGSTAATSGAISFTGTGNQTFTPKSGTTYTNITENKPAGTLTVAAALTAGTYTITKGTTSTFSSTFDATNLTITNATSTVFTGAATITNYSDSTTAGAITFSAGGTIKSATTMKSTGTITISAAQTLSITDGATPPADANFIHTAGSTVIAGELKAADIELASTTLSGTLNAAGTATLDTIAVSGTAATISATSIITDTISATAATDEITLKASNGSFTTSQIGADANNKIGASEISFNNVTFDSGNSSDLFFSNKTIIAETLTLKVPDNYKLKLSGNITIIGSNGFISPLDSSSKPLVVELSDATTITTSGPVTLYDNLAGDKNLTITNTGIFTLNETAVSTDPVDSETPASTSAAVATFNQNGTGGVSLFGDISATDNISFASAITLYDNVKLGTSGGAINFSSSITDSAANAHILVTSASTSTNFIGEDSSVDGKSLTVNGDLIVNKSAQTKKLTLNLPVIANSNFTLSKGTVAGTGKVTVKGNFTDSDIWTGTGDIEVTGSAEQIFTPGKINGSPTNYSKIIINKITAPDAEGATSPTGKVDFSTNNLKVSTIEINGTANFNTAFEIVTLTNTATSGDILFNADGSIATNTDIQTKGSVKIAQNKTLAISDGATYYNFTHNSGSTELAGSIEGNAVSLGTIKILENTSLTAASGVTFAGGATTADKKTFTGTTTHTLTIYGDLTINDFYDLGSDSTETQFITLNPETNTLTNNGTSAFNKITFTGNVANSTAKTLEIKEDSTINGSFTNNGTFTIASDKTFKLSTDFTNNGTVTANTGSTFELINPGKDTKISGSSTFYNFICNEAGKTIIFEKGKTQTINGKIVLSGASGSLINLISSVTGTQWDINCTGSNADNSFNFIDAQDSNNTSAYRLNATNSTDSGNNDRWNFTDSKYTWEGNGGDTNWFNKGNWNPKSVPGIGTEVTIANVANNPILEHNLEDQNSNTEYASLGSTGKLIVANAAQLDLATFDLTVQSIENSGRIRLSGAQTITGVTTGSRPSFTNNTDSIVEYYGTLRSDGNAAMGTSYAKLEFTNGANGSIAEDITVGQNTLINNGSGNPLTLSGNNTFTGDVTISSGTIDIISAENIKLTAPVNCDKLTLTATDKTVDFAGSVTATDFINISASNLTIGTDLSAGSTITITSNETTLNGNLSAGSASDITITTAPEKAVTFTGSDSAVSAKILKVINGSIIVDKTANTNILNFNLPVTIGTDLSVKKGNVSFKNTSSESLTVLGNIETSTETSITLYGTTSAKNLINAGAFTTETTGALTLSGDLVNSNSITNNSTISIAGNLTDTNATWGEGIGKIIFNGTENQNFNTNPITKYFDVTVNKSAGNIKFTPDFKANSVTITKVADCLFDSTVQIDTFNMDQAANTQFKSITTIGSLTDTSKSGNITFFTNATISSDTNFLTTGTLNFGSGTEDELDSQISTTFGAPSTYKSVTHTAGETILYGTLNCSDASFGTTDCKTNLIINCDNLELSGNVTSNTAYLKVNGNIITSNRITISPNLLLNGSFSGDGLAALENNFYLLPGQEGTQIETGTITVAKDIIIDTPRNILTSGTISATNIVVYRGNITAKAESILSASKDFIILGSEYDIENKESGNKTEFMYQQDRLSKWNYNRKDFTSTSTSEDLMPDNTLLSTVETKFSAVYTSEGNSVIKAGKNFYANGTSLTGTNKWFIDIPDITNAKNGFAETINSTISYSTIRCITDNSADGSKAKMPAFQCEDNGNNINWLFDNFHIVEAQTERDNVIKITFNRPIRNANSELISSISRFSNNAEIFEGFYTDPDCQNPLKVENISSGIIYIKAKNTWNTDATGKSAGTDFSTDRNGIHKQIIPYIQIKTLNTNSAVHISDIWGKRIVNYDESNRFTDVTDHTGPVLYSVRTGQELHTPYDGVKGAEGQPSYDSHNFIEFRYSEKVNFGDTSLPKESEKDKANYDNSDISKSIWLPSSDSTMNNQYPSIDNVRVRDYFGAIENDITQPGNLIISGLGTIESGLLHTGNNGKTDKYVNALYRTDQYSIRLSIAGYTENTVKDRNGAQYKKWIGYIESAVQPSGTVTMPDPINTKITDCALGLDGKTPLYNPQELYKNNQIVPVVNQCYAEGSDYINSGVYGNWDLSAPTFAPLRLNTSTLWGNKDYYEAVGNTSGAGSTLDKIEFHLFDNTPSFTEADAATWLTEKGWCFNNTDNATTLYDSLYTYCADIIGGARQFDSNANQRTSGGIRYSSIDNCAPAFKYIDMQTSTAVPTKPFDNSENGIYPGSKASLFIGSSPLRRAADDPDGLYFGIGLSEMDLPTSKSFTISYDDSIGYITDLAGNRLRSATIRTIDRTPPSFDIILSPVSQKEIYAVFVKKLVSDSSLLKFRNNEGDETNISEQFETLIPKCFELISIDANGNPIINQDIQIDYSVPARIENVISDVTTQEFTILRLTLTSPVTLPAVEKLYIRTRHPEGYDELTQDPITGIKNSRVSFVQDYIGNYMQMYTAHVISDIAINAIKTLYAYDSDMTYNSDKIMDGLYEQGSWAVHDWNEEQQNYGTLPANHPYGIVSDIITETESSEDLPSGVRIFLSASPNKESIASQFNSDLNRNIRVWLPEVTNGLLPAFSLKNNPAENYFQTDSMVLKETEALNRIEFNIPKEISEQWGPGQQVSFVYGILGPDGNPYRIYPSPYYDVSSGKYNLLKSDTVPLYSVRLKDSSDITSLDLWSFKTKATTEQRGGVTILNNVINATNGEKTVVKVNMPVSGNLNVIVMTADGSIVTYLNHGQTDAGEHFYSWNGTNNKKTPVARGIYFIRVTGNGLDETRKVMVVK